MINFQKFLFTVSCLLFCIVAKCQTNELYHTVVRLDSIYFKAYNECDIATQQELFSDSIEFYHDKSGLSTSKTDLIEAIKKNICGKVTRELVKGSIEVSPIPGYGAVEIGEHKFHNKEEKNQVPKPSKFVIIWRNKDNKWTITRVISLHGG
ncbi:MAG TPA: nuclear transport factor 2 family protein [Flavisolibacter sp.]|nr:nuclear transport factor 2 family protein [Flavisolibacter sp.]